MVCNHFKFINVIFIIIVSACFIYCDDTKEINKNQNANLYMIIKNSKWGFIDEKGKIIIEPRFDDVDNYYEGLCNVELKDKWGFIDKTGKWIVKPKYEFAYSFNEGRAAVRLNNKCGYIDRTGKVVIDYQFKYANWFNEGLAFVAEYNDDKYKNSDEEKYGFIDLNGKLVLPFNYEFNALRKESEWPGYGFKEELANVRVHGEHKVIYIDKKGNQAIKPQFDMADPFKNGYAVVSVFSTNMHYTQGIIDKKGDYVIRPIYNYCSNVEKVEDDFLALVTLNGKSGYINMKGQEVIKFQYDYLSHFSEGLVAVKNKSMEFENDGNYFMGYIDITGKMIISPQFVSAGDFKNGLAACSVYLNKNDKKPKFGYIDKSGQFVIKPQYDFASSFDENRIALIKMGDEEWSAKWGYINRKGEYVWGPTN